MDTTCVYNIIQYWLYNVQCVYMPQSLDDYLDSWVLCCYGSTDMVSVAIVLRRSHQMLMRRIKKSCSQMASMPWPSVLSSMVCVSVCLSVCLCGVCIASGGLAVCMEASLVVLLLQFMSTCSSEVIYQISWMNLKSSASMMRRCLFVCVSVCLSVTCVCVCSRVCPRVFMYIRTFVGNVYIYLSELMQ